LQAELTTLNTLTLATLSFVASLKRFPLFDFTNAKFSFLIFIAIRRAFSWHVSFLLSSYKSLLRVAIFQFKILCISAQFYLTFNSNFLSNLALTKLSACLGRFVLHAQVVFSFTPQI